MKKFLVLFLTLILIVTALTACGEKKSTKDNDTATNGADTTQSTEPAATEPAEKVENVDINLVGKWESIVNLSDLSNAPLEGSTRYHLEFTEDECTRSIEGNISDLIVNAILVEIEKDATANGMTLDQYFANEGTTKDAYVASIRSELGTDAGAPKTDSWKIEGTNLIIGSDTYPLVKVDNFNIKLTIAGSTFAFTKK